MKYIFLSAFLLASFPTFAVPCRLPKGDKLKIGCTRKCSGKEKFRLNFTALFEGHNLEFVDLTTYPTMEAGLADIDALLVPGGADINPIYYMDDVTPEMRNYLAANLSLAKVTAESNRRDPFEHGILKKYSDDDTYSHLPLLGICRGMQMMTVAQGIPLYLDIKTELVIPNRVNKLDYVTVHGAPDSTMESLYQNRGFYGWELHHQGLRLSYYNQHRASYPNVRVSATSNNSRIAEAIEWTHRTALGVQFHPEISFHRASYPVLSWLLTKACDYKVNFKDYHE